MVRPFSVMIMAKKSTSKRAARRSKASADSVIAHRAKRIEVVQNDAKRSQVLVRGARFEAVMRAAEQSGLLSDKSGRIAARVSPALVKQAKQQTGIETDTDLIAFALATVAVEDDFARTFREARGKLDPALKLGF